MSDSGSDGTKNKRKFSSELPADILKLSSSSLTEFPKYEDLPGRDMLDDKQWNTLDEFGVEDLGKSFKRLELNDLEWEDPVARQLMGLLAQNLRHIFDSAVKRIVQSGYTKEFAEQLILKSGLYHGLKDVLSNATEGALSMMSGGKESGPSEGQIFEDIGKMVDFTLLEMVNVLRQLKPGSSVAEAMWCLLICDMNLWHALAVYKGQVGLNSLEDTPEEGLSGRWTPLSNLEGFKGSRLSFCTQHVSQLLAVKGDWSKFLNPACKCNSCSNFSNRHCHEVSGKGSSVPPESSEKSSGISRLQVETQAAAMEEKSGGGPKVSLGNMKRDMLRQKAICLEKGYKGRVSKGYFRAKLIPISGMAFEKQIRLPSGSSCAATKSTCSKLGTSFGAGGPIFHGNNRDMNNSVPVLQLSNDTNIASMINTTLQSKSVAMNSGHSSEEPDYCAGILYDEAEGRYMPKDEHEEYVLGLVSEMKRLKKEIQDWTDWTNEKVMQATRKLTKDLVEMKMLRQEREEIERLKKENPTTEGTTIKRLSEMEHALSNAGVQIETATLALHRLEDESSVLQKELEAAKMKALRITSDLHEATKREQEMMKKYQSAQLNKLSLQEELAALRRRKADLLLQLEAGRTRKEQLEVLWRREEGEKLKYHEDAMRKRSETEKQRAQANVEEDKMREQSESLLQKYKDDINKLEAEISQRRFASDSAKMASLFGSAGTGFVGNAIEDKIASSCEEFDIPRLYKRLEVFQGNFGADSEESKRECVMCLTEEMSVLFIPCAHQVLCSDCNALHEKQGMTDCPSCRTPIQKRIQVLFAESSDH